MGDKAEPEFEKNQPIEPDDEAILKESKPGKVEKSKNWLIDKVLPSAFTLPLGILIGWWLNSSAPNLQYNVGEVIRFSGEKEEFGLLIVSVANTGNKRAEKVVCQIDLGKSTFHDIKVGPSILQPSLKHISDTVMRVEVETLNPSENIEIALKASDPQIIEKNVTVRANDIVGKRGIATTRNFLNAADMCAIAAIMTLFGTLIYDRFRDSFSKIN